MCTPRWQPWPAPCRPCPAGSDRSRSSCSSAIRCQRPRRAVDGVSEPQVLRVALTGGIATGKSYVLDRFRRRGVPCLDADELAHGVEAAGTEATAQIAARFGAGVLAADGSVNRAKLGAIVFANPSERRELEAIVHPAVYRAIAAGL